MLLQTRPAIIFSKQSELPITIRVDDGLRYQKMDGFGASFTDSSAWLIWTKLTAAQRNQLMQNLFSPSGIGLNVLRQPMGATDFALSNYTYNDLPAGQTDPDMNLFSIEHDRAYVIPVLQESLALNPNMRVMALPWSPPAWMKTNGSLNGGGLKSQRHAALARYFVKFIQAYQANGIPVHLIALQNEPLFAGNGYPTMFLTPAQEAEIIGRHLGPALEQAGLRTQILGYEHNWDVLYPERLLRNQSASRYIAGTSFHCYAGDRETAQSAIRQFFPSKDIWFTECTGGAWAPDFAANLGWFMENLIIGATRNWAKSVVFWNIALDQAYGPTNGGCPNCRGVVTIDWTTSPATVRYEVEYYALGHASKFVVPGAYRIRSDSFGPGGVQTVAFKNPDN
jgi:glucosylceramidase